MARKKADPPREVTVSYDNDKGWIVEHPVNGEIQIHDSYFGSAGDMTKRDAVAIGRKVAKERGLPLRVYNMKGKLETKVDREVAEEPLPCPCCGGEPKLGFASGNFAIFCKTCGLRLEIDYTDYIKKAHALGKSGIVSMEREMAQIVTVKWNRRTP